MLPGEKKGELSPEWHVEWQINRMTDKKVFILSPHFDSSIGRNTLSSFGYIYCQNVPKFVDERLTMPLRGILTRDLNINHFLPVKY